MERVPRELVIFTPGHTLTGTIHLFSETDVETFVDSPDPRFVALVDVTARSLADRRVISHFGLVLVNRTQMTAASLLENAGGAHETGVSVDWSVSPGLPGGGYRPLANAEHVAVGVLEPGTASRTDLGDEVDGLRRLVLLERDTPRGQVADLRPRCHRPRSARPSDH